MARIWAVPGLFKDVMHVSAVDQPSFSGKSAKIAVLYMVKSVC